MIKVENITKTFEKTKALDGLSLHAAKSSVYGLVGPNGAGKTTLLKHLSGIYKQDASPSGEGAILIDGEQVFENPKLREKYEYGYNDYFIY